MTKKINHSIFMKALSITLIACLFVITAAAQNATEGVEKKMTKINALYPSFEQEFRLSPVTTWSYRAGFNISLAYGDSYSYDNSFFGSTSHVEYFEFLPTAEVNYRWYYRLLKRQEKGRKTINNSAGYFFAGAEVATPGIKLQTVNNDGLHDVISGIYAGWGFRRTIGKKITIDLNLRYSLLMRNVEETAFSNIIPGFKVGYRIK